MKRIILAVILAMVGGFSALAQTDPLAYTFLTGISMGDCNGLLVIMQNGTDNMERYYATIVKADGKIYMDEFFKDVGTNTSLPWGLYSSNNRHMQTAAFPLPKKTPITVESTVFDLEGSPEWRSTATISKCNKNPKLTKIVNHQATPLQRNGSFEYFHGVDESSTPDDWTPNDAYNDAASGISCASAVAINPCVLRIVPNGTKQQLTQIYTPDVPIGGKYIELGAFQSIESDSVVKGVIKATLKFADGSKTTLKLTSKKHAIVEVPLARSDMAYKYAVIRAKMPAKLVSAKIVITEKGGSSGAWLIDGISLSVYKKSKFTPPTPERLPLPAAG